MINLKSLDFFGPKETHAVFVFREGNADECTIQATYREDEYKFANYPPAPGQWMIDAGGYIGSTAILYAQLYPQAKVIVIEPLPENCELIKKNIENNGLQDRIILIEKALFNSNGEKIQIYYRDNSPIGVAHKFVGSSSTKYTESVGSKFWEAETITLEKIFNDYKIEFVRLLKMDLECSEYKALENVPENILKKIHTIKGEYHNPDKALIKYPRTALYNLVKNVFDDRSSEPETNFIGAFEFERKNI
jgi:FkbM family methyltransferase